MMIRVLTYELYRALKRGAQRLSDDAIELMSGYMETQRTVNDTFVNRGGKEDLYYTMFGWVLASVLGIKTDGAKRRAYLQSIHEAELDDFHKVVYAQAVETDRLLRHGLLWYAVGWLIRGMKDCLPDFFREYAERRPDADSVNMMCATLVVDGLATGFSAKRNGQMLRALCSLQDETGGWRQSPMAEMPDLLTTAVALFTLGLYGVAPTYETHDFVDAHWKEDGSFAPNLLDEQSDTEYMFYGLLAIGAK